MRKNTWPRRRYWISAWTVTRRQIEHELEGATLEHAVVTREEVVSGGQAQCAGLVADERSGGQLLARAIIRAMPRSSAGWLGSAIS